MSASTKTVIKLNLHVFISKVWHRYFTSCHTPSCFCPAQTLTNSLGDLNAQNKHGIGLNILLLQLASAGKAVGAGDRSDVYGHLCSVSSSGWTSHCFQHLCRVSPKNLLKPGSNSCTAWQVQNCSHICPDCFAYNLVRDRQEEIELRLRIQPLGVFSWLLW